MDAELVYFADPMCSWCWGFAPTLERLLAHCGNDIPLAVVMGGLFAGNRKPLDERGKETIREHWDHVRDASGQPFDYRFFERRGFIYDTAPSCRAVVTARRLAPASALSFLATVHAAFYRDNRDVTEPDTLCQVGEEFGFDGGRFAREFFGEQSAKETERDFVMTQRAGVQGFPTLLGVRDGAARLLSPGFQPWEAIERVVDHWLAGATPPSAET